jgi:hypothetical protein
MVPFFFYVVDLLKPYTKWAQQSYLVSLQKLQPKPLLYIKRQEV